MTRISAVALLCLAVLAISTQVASAHSPYKKELQTIYGLKTVSCYTCHARKADVPADKLEAFAKNSKSFLNAFGEGLYKITASGGYTAKIQAAKDAGDDAKKEAVEAEATTAFKAALKKVGQVKSASGKTYHEELTAGTLDGVKK
jgi:hypothetical protein